MPTENEILSTRLRIFPVNYTNPSSKSILSGYWGDTVPQYWGNPASQSCIFGRKSQDWQYCNSTLCQPCLSGYTLDWPRQAGWPTGLPQPCQASCMNVDAILPTMLPTSCQAILSFRGKNAGLAVLPLNPDSTLPDRKVYDPVWQRWDRMDWHLGAQHYVNIASAWKFCLWLI